MSREVITVFTGQAGCQMGNAIWELLCAEHGIRADGSISGAGSYMESVPGETAAGFFYETSKKRFVPRAIFSDLEDLVISEIKHGRYRALFHPECLVCGKEDAASIFARGYHSIGQTKIESVMDAYRGLLEGCDSVSGIMTVHSSGGGTGSGFTSLVLDQLKEESPKTAIIDCNVCPSGSFASNTVEPYNAILGAHYTMSNVDVSFLWDNDALYYICANRVCIRNPTFNCLNRLTSQIYSSMTACLRYGGDLSSHLADYQTNLVPYPRLHFPITSYSPVSPPCVIDAEVNSLGTMTKLLFQKDHLMCSCNTEKGKYISCCLMYRGNINPVEIYQTVRKLKNSKKMNFVDWCPTGMKISICGIPPVTIVESGLAATDRNVMMMTNNSAVGEIFGRLKTKFEHLYQRRAFLFWFVGDGMEEGEFKEAVDDINALVMDYAQSIIPSEDDPNEPCFPRPEQVEHLPVKKMSKVETPAPVPLPSPLSRMTATGITDSEIDMEAMKKEVEAVEEDKLEFLRELDLHFSDEGDAKPLMAPLKEEPELIDL